MLQICCILLFLPVLPALPVLPNPDPAPIQPFHPSSPPSTIPAFPEQSDLSGCPLDLPDDLFPALDRACGRSKNRHLVKARCCPALATWLYSAYSRTALGRAGRLPATSYDLPVLPDDSETCVENLEKALRGRGIELLRPNDTCDAVYCYCGIRLHVPSCTDAFVVTDEGRLVGDSRVRALERECRAGSGLGGCTRCLQTLHQVRTYTGCYYCFK